MSCLHGWQRHLSAGRDQVLGSSAGCLHLDYTTCSTGHQVLNDMPLWHCSGSPLLCAGWCFFSQALQSWNGALCPPHSEFFSHCWKSFRDSRSPCSELPAPGFEQRGHSSCTSCQPVFPLPFSSPSASTILRCLYPHSLPGCTIPPSLAWEFLLSHVCDALPHLGSWTHHFLLCFHTVISSKTGMVTCLSLYHGCQAQCLDCKGLSRTTC